MRAPPPNRSPAVRGQQWEATADSGGRQPVVEVFNGSCCNTCKRRMVVSDASVFLVAEVRLLHATSLPPLRGASGGASPRSSRRPRPRVLGGCPQVG